MIVYNHMFVGCMCDLPQGVGKVEREANSRGATGPSRTVEAILLKMLKSCMLSIELNTARYESRNYKYLCRTEYTFYVYRCLGVA